MDGAYVAEMRARGRLVVPAALRRRVGWDDNTLLHFLETDRGVVVMTRDQLKAYVRSQWEGLDLVGELLAERRAAAETDLADTPPMT